MVERGGTCKGEGQPRIPGIRTATYGRPGASRNAKARNLSGRRRSPSRRHAVSSRALPRGATLLSHKQSRRTATSMAVAGYTFGFHPAKPGRTGLLTRWLVDINWLV